MASTATLANLLRQGTIDDHDELLKAANATLKTSMSDLEAHHVKVVALLKLDRFEEAIHALEAGGDTLKERAKLEHAYALYKTGKPEEAARIAGSSNDRGSKHVEAQARYRSEDFKRAAELYSSLSNEHGQVSNEDVDLRINSSAVDAQLEWSHSGHLAKSKKPGRQDLEAFETAYNAACGCIARGELGQAEVLLKRSKDLCDALDDLSEDEKRAELLPITVQQVYVLTCLGRTEEAEKLGDAINKTEISDATSRTIAQVNSLANSSLDNPFILQRHLQTSSQIPESDKPFAFQKSALQQNSQGVALSAQKYDGTARSSHAVIKAHPAPTLDGFTNTTSVLNFAAQARNKSGKEALKIVLPELEKRPKDVGLILIVVQLYVLAGNKDTATSLLERFLEGLSNAATPADQDVRHAPGLVATMVSLYSSRGQTSRVRGELSRAASYWREKLKSSPSELTPSVASLLKAAGGALLGSSSEEDWALAQAIFNDLGSHDTSDPYIAAGVIASSSSDISQLQLSTLTPVDRLTSSISVTDLENAGIARPPKAPTATSTASKRAAEPVKTERKAKKPKPSKLPKDYDETKKPDPERWLPLRDRSGYRPKGKKGKQRSNMLAQGAVEEISRPGTPGTPVEKQAGGGGGGGGGKQAQKKKKGKGNKW
ncbi:hypothetical protein K461DRAFT_259172 [Myriangium duriaei CBS 260.36]|uniref:Signal recognition particle subunit SRP72 n=1 Tax=Myriangium duriaei CBS 260.36 TaxID=1168546 RepID=A0A9P4J1G0_9PEZI|nr:hypothetical protein K461DRAFT_259172 [Myriangium duriaei CBS 260.36]